MQNSVNLHNAPHNLLMKRETIKDQVLAQLWPHVHELEDALVVSVGVQHKVNKGLRGALWNVCEVDVHCFKIPDERQPEI